MKVLIDKITNKDRLIKLYGCSECKRATEIKRYVEGKSPLCPDCNGKGYTINRDSHVLDIVDNLTDARIYMRQGFEYYNGLYECLAQALIKLIELAYNEASDREWIFFKSTELNIGTDIDSGVMAIIDFVIRHNYTMALSQMTFFCDHHKIDMWQSVREILETTPC